MKRIDSAISAAFAKGLAVFSGKSKFENIARGKFAMVSSVIDEGDVYYIDQWFPGHMGGGQEILETGDKRYTRVYAGGTVRDGILAPLGITKDDVMGFLKQSLLEAGGNTRFDAAYARKDGEWNYQYVPGDIEQTTGMITGEEAVSYKNTPVFVHFFIISHVIA